MSAETAKRFEALENLAAKLRQRFMQADYEFVAPAIVQPADIFLDFLGETVRGRTYVFSDLDGHELCLRPDFTVPVARLYLERFPKAGETARYCYNGPVFRYTRAGKAKPASRELRQTGIELYAHHDAEQADAEVMRLTLDAIEAAGITRHRLKIGDLALFGALVDAIDMPDRWRARLKHHFWRRDTFGGLLKGLSSRDEADRRHGDWPKLTGLKRNAAEEAISAHLDAQGIPLVGARALEEITARLVEREADRQNEPLAPEKADLIRSYLAIVGPPRAVVARLADLADSGNINLAAALKRFERRLDQMRDSGIECRTAEFSADFGRDFQYYTGCVFQIEASDIPEIGPIAGGGRYDRLLADLGAPRSVPAIGAAIHTERLLAAIEGVLE